MRTLRSFVSIVPVAFALLSGTPVLAQQAEPPAATTAPNRDTEKIKAIRTLIEVSGTIRAMRDAVDVSIDQQAQLNPSVPDEFWVRFKARFKPEEIVERLLPIYDKHFTKEEIDALIAFYQTPAGKKLATKQSVLQTDSMAVGQQYGLEIGQEVSDAMQKDAAKPKAPATKPAKSGKSGSSTPKKP
jgi:uncharacterized protein